MRVRSRGSAMLINPLAAKSRANRGKGIYSGGAQGLFDSYQGAGQFERA